MTSVSVVIPLYNKAPYIQRAISSILSQTIQPEEIIVIDDGSTDGGGELVQALSEPRLRVFRQENQGPGNARNRGISEAGGNLIAFLDADDAWKPRFLEVISYLHELYPRAGAYATNFEIITPTSERQIPAINNLPPGASHGLISNYFQIWRPISSAIAIPKKVLEQIGMFPVAERLHEDLDTFLRIALSYPIAWSNECLATWYQNSANRACLLVPYSQEPAISRTAREAIAAELVPLEQREDLREYAAYFQLRAAKGLLMQGNKELALQLLELARGTVRYTQSKPWRWLWMASFPGNLLLWYENMKIFERTFRRKIKNILRLASGTNYFA
ncbi:MAG: glycosyltransferase family 2 protein [Desulfobacteraceae bacterium]